MASPSDQLGERLRAWRASRRMSQFELALRAGTTQRHISFIEQGRSRPGRQMVLRLAESLELSLRDRNSLLLAGGYAPVYAESRLDDTSIAPVMEALQRILDGHLPFPALVVETGSRLVAANDALDVLTEGAAPDLLEEPINVLRLAVHPRGMGRRVENLAEWGRHIIENVRAHAARNPDPRLDALLAELELHVPPAAPGHDHLGFSVPLRLRTKRGTLTLITTITSFATALDVTLSELHLEAYLPADAETARLLRDARVRPLVDECA